MFPNLSKLSLGTGKDGNIDVSVENNSKLFFLFVFLSVIDKSVRIARFNTEFVGLVSA